jgi:hypothetical protein
MNSIRRPYRYFALTALWFLAVGPAVTVVLPPILPFAYMAGAIPAFLTGIAFSWRYRSTGVPQEKWFRAQRGAGYGAIVSSAFFVVSYLAMNRGFPSYEQPAAYRTELEGLLAGLGALAFTGSIAGAFAATLMPKRLRTLGESKDYAQV